MKHLKEYIEQEPIFSDLNYNELSEEDKLQVSKTFGFEMYKSGIEFGFAWDELKQSIIDSMESKWQRWLIKTWFKIKGI